MQATHDYGKENVDGQWKLTIAPPTGWEPRWEVRRYKNSPVGWIETGDPKFYYNKESAVQYAYRNGYNRLVY